MEDGGRDGDTICGIGYNAHATLQNGGNETCPVWQIALFRRAFLGLCLKPKATVLLPRQSVTVYEGNWGSRGVQFC